MKKERQSNFELMRIVSILFIIMWHAILHGGIFKDIGEPYNFISRCILSLLIVHVNSLIFVTGYFIGNSKDVKLSKILKLIGVGWFYGSISLAIIHYTGLNTFSKIRVMEDLLPLSLNSYWFLNYYVILYLFSPYLNKVTEKMNQKDYLKFLLTLIIALSIIPAITNNQFISNNGYGLANFIIMYYLGSYFKKYPIQENLWLQKISYKKRRILFLGLFFLIAIIRISIFYLGEKMGHVDSQIIGYWGAVIQNSFLSYSSVFVLIQTCLYCLIFESINIKSKIINYMASTTLGIYLIHDNTNVRDVLYKTLNVTRFGASKKAFLMLLGVTLLIYVSCFLIESTRKFFTWVLKKIIKKLIKKEKSKTLTES